MATPGVSDRGLESSDIKNMSWRSADESSPNGKDGKLKTEAAGSKAETETHETLAMKLQNASSSGRDSDFKIFPRRKGGQQKKNNDSAPVVITAEVHFV